MFRYNIGVSILFAALSIGVMAGASRLQPAGFAKFGPGYWPYFLGSALLALSLALLAETLVRRWLEKRRRDVSGPAPEAEKPPFEFRSPGLICVYKICGLLLLFVILLHQVNFLFATVVFTPLCMRLLGLRKIAALASLTVGLPLAVHIVFAWILKIRLP